MKLASATGASVQWILTGEGPREGAGPSDQSRTIELDPNVPEDRWEAPLVWARANPQRFARLGVEIDAAYARARVRQARMGAQLRTSEACFAMIVEAAENIADEAAGRAELPGPPIEEGAPRRAAAGAPRAAAGAATTRQKAPAAMNAGGHPQCASRGRCHAEAGPVTRPTLTFLRPRSWPTRAGEGAGRARLG